MIFVVKEFFEGTLMSYAYSGVDSLQGKHKVGSKQCVALIQHYTAVGTTTTWKAGAKVLGNMSISKGIAIATFVNEKYPNRPHGNHAAFYLGQDAMGIWVMDQWADDIKKPTISRRYIRKRGGINRDGSYPHGGDNAEAYSIIEKDN